MAFQTEAISCLTMNTYYHNCKYAKSTIDSYECVDTLKCSACIKCMRLTYGMKNVKNEHYCTIINEKNINNIFLKIVVLILIFLNLFFLSSKIQNLLNFFLIKSHIKIIFNSRANSIRLKLEQEVAFCAHVHNRMTSLLPVTTCLYQFR